MASNKKKLTPKQREFVRSIKSMIGEARSLNKIASLLQSHGYIMVDFGAFKKVFRYPGDKYCIKVYKNDTDWMEDSYSVPEHISKYYVHPIYIDKRFMIQKWVEQAAKFDKTKVKKIPRSIIKRGYHDLHINNLRYDGHRQVIIDFMY